MNPETARTADVAGTERSFVVTIHGTWAKGAPWARAESPLACALLQWFRDHGIEATVIPFVWSGRNSVFARRQAASDLCKLLDRVRHDDPHASLHVIAHSHGGSVFAYATKLRPDLAGKVDGFVAMATPWLGLEPRSFSSALRLLLGKLKIFTAFAASLAVLPFFVQVVLRMTSGRPMLIEIPSESSPQGAQEIPGPIYDINLPHFELDPLYLWAPTVVAAFLGVALFFPLQRWASKELEDSMAAFHLKLLATANQSSTLNERLPPSVFLKPVGDEAALALTLTSALTALSQSLATVLFVTMQWVRDRWVSLPRFSRLVLASLFLAAWSVGTMEIERPFIVSVLKMYHELTMTPIQNLR